MVQKAGIMGAMPSLAWACAWFSDSSEHAPASEGHGTRFLQQEPIIPLPVKFDTSYTNPKRKRGKNLSTSLALRVGVVSGRERYKRQISTARCGNRAAYPALPASLACRPATEIHPFSQQLLLNHIARTTSIRPPFPADGSLLRLSR